MSGGASGAGRSEPNPDAESPGGPVEVRGVTHAWVDPWAVVEDAACVGEGLEAPPAVVLARPGVADAPERELGNQRVNRAVVDDGIGGLGRAEDLLSDVVVLGEDVETEGVRVGLDPLDDRLHRIDLEDGQDRSEHLIAHDGRVPRDIDQHGRSDVQVIEVIRATHDRCSAAEESSESLSTFRWMMRALAPQLEDRRCEVLRRGSMDPLPSRRHRPAGMR
jgi:hypothetical protein